jgi:toxin ParE1/3/4
MAHRIVWSFRALADLEAIASYIEADSPNYARAVVRRIVAATRSLGQFPHSGRKVPEFDDEAIRELFPYSYRVMYLVQEDKVTIVAVIHGERMV